MSQRVRRIIGIVTVAIFALYYANICFFYHGHIVNGVTIVHSHFHDKAHPLNNAAHSESQLTLISALSLFQSCAPALFFAALTLFLALTAILLVANYVFTVTAPKRYEVMMAFITLSSLLTAMMTNPPETILTERVAMIIAGVLIASIANRVILPYRLADENIVLGGRYVDVTGGQIRSLGDAADGRRDPMGETALVLRAATISSKMRMNVTSRRDLAVDMLLSRQDNLTARIMLLSRSMETADSRCRGIIRDMVGGFDPSGPPETVDTDGLDDKEADLVREAAGILDGYRRDRALYSRISGAGAQHL